MSKKKPRPIEKEETIQEEAEESKTPPFNYVAFFIYVGVMLLVPLIPGLITYFSLNRLVYMEGSYIILGILSLLLVTIRLHFRDGANYKKNKSVAEDKDSPSYKQWIRRQWIFGIGGLVNIGVSLIVFFIGSGLGVN
ncbi:MAG: hypothetical protein K5694_05615 [Bacilli bacterium]|nr:hypothetical protein [Bacilli bacterium]